MYPLKFMPIHLKRSNFPLFKYFTVEEIRGRRNLKYAMRGGWTE